MSVIELEREAWQYQADRGLGNPLWESWEWRTMKGDHYWYSGDSHIVYQVHDSHVVIIMDEVNQFWFPEKIGFRPLFVGHEHVGDEEYGKRLILKTERVVSFTSRDWPIIPSGDGDLQTWVTLKDGEWIKELVAR
jgi:hypothetical protein